MDKDVGQIAKEWYEKNEPEGAFAAGLLRCFFFGTIIRRPGFLLMGETAFWDGEDVKMVSREDANCWWIHFWTSSGQMSSYELCLEAPFPLPFVAFKRRNKVRILKWDTLYAKDIGYQQRTYERR